jgi:hypothetical protein
MSATPSTASIYAVIDPSDDPSVVSRPPAPRKPVRKTADTSAAQTPAIAQAVAESDALLAQAAAVPRPAEPIPAPTTPAAYPYAPVEKQVKYTRVQFITDIGVYSVPARSVAVSDYGVMVELPASDDMASFVPAVGTKLSIGSTSGRYKCYYPGTEFDRPGSKVLVFIRTEDHDGKE